MLALAHHYDEPVASGGVLYTARVYGAADTDGRWGGWIVFFPVLGGRVIATDRETTQTTFADLSYWASGLTHTYIEGALERAIALQPEAVMARELDRLEREERDAEERARTLEAAASLARAESRLAEAERERTEEALLSVVAETAETDAAVHEAAAKAARREGEAADKALRARTRTPAARKKR